MRCGINMKCMGFKNIMKGVHNRRKHTLSLPRLVVVWMRWCVCCAWHVLGVNHRHRSVPLLPRWSHALASIQLGRTALIIAAYWNNVEIAEILLERKADIHAKDTVGRCGCMGVDGCGIGGGYMCMRACVCVYVCVCVSAWVTQ